MRRWQLCQAIEAAGGLKPADWLWLSQPRSEYPQDCALVLEPGCGSLDQLAAHFPGRSLRVLTHPLGPRQRCRSYPCPVSSQDWLLLVGEPAARNAWEERPLYGQTIALTREPSQAVELQKTLQELGAEVLLCPVLAFVEPDQPELLQKCLDELESYDWVLFTSPNGVRTFFAALEQQGDARRLGRAKLAAIGPGTARSLGDRGLRADVVPARSLAEGLLEALQDFPMEGRRVLLPRAQEAREVLPEQLRLRGARVDVAPCYKTVMPQPPPQLAEAEVVVLMSSSAARNFRSLCEGDPDCLCIGPVTAETAREVGFRRVTTAARYDLEGVVEALLSRPRRERPPASSSSR